MKKLLQTCLIIISLSLTANAQTKDTTINIYGVNAKTDKNQDSHGGVGVMFDSEAVKVKLEGTSDFIKAGAVLKFNPNNSKWYVKVGANAINQKMYAPDNATARVNQYSGSLATGYMVANDLYIELGGSLTELKGKKINVDYEIVDETTKLAYIEVAKRWDTSFGTIDTTANVGEVNYEFKDNESSYGVGVDYYPTSNSKIGIKYQDEKNNDVAVFSAGYGYVFAEYTDKIDANTYHVNVGIKIAFTDLFDTSTYKMPKNIKPHLSELHRFEDISFGANMQIQSSSGVEKTVAKIAKDNAPIATDVSVNALGNDVVTHNLNANISDAQSADNLLTINVVSAPTHGALAWNGNEFTYEVTEGSGYNGDDSFTYKVTDPDSGVSSTKTVTITGIVDS